MKKGLIICLCCILLISTAYAAFENINFSSYSNEELIALETALQEEKISRGIAKTATVYSGKYTIGVDFPAGTYRVETSNGVADHLEVYNASGKRIASYAIGTASERSPIGKLELHDGETIEFDSCTLVFTVYSGGIVFE